MTNFKCLIDRILTSVRLLFTMDASPTVVVESLQSGKSKESRYSKEATEMA